MTDRIYYLFLNFSILCVISLPLSVSASTFEFENFLMSPPPGYDNSTAEALIAIKKEFVPGQTISASEMNKNF